MTVRIMVYCNAGISGKIFYLRYYINHLYIITNLCILYCSVEKKKIILLYCIVFILQKSTVDCGELLCYFPQLHKQESRVTYDMIYLLTAIGVNPGGSNTVQYSTVQYSTVQYSAVQCSAVQCSAVQCSAVQCSAVQCSAVRCSAVQCSAVQCSAVQCSTVQYSTVQYSTVQYSTVQYSTVQYCTHLHTNPVTNFSSAMILRHQHSAKEQG
jgi:hypothetical protein